MMEIKKVGVVGCGVMGSGIANNCAQKGYQVVVSEMNQELIDNGIASIDKFLSTSIKKGKMTEKGKEETLSRIKGTVSLKDFHDCDIVIEAASEVMSVKQGIFSELDKICPPHTILATNTSVLCVVEIGSTSKRLDKVVGLHFMNPVPIMKLVEMVRTVATSEETMEISKEFCKSLGKTVVIAQDTPGFIVNKMFAAFHLAAVRLVQDGVATAEDIDTAVKLGLNHPMGPLEMLDWGGLQAFYDGVCGMYEDTHDPTYAPPPLMKRMIKAGHLGRRAGRGFYDYSKKD